MGDIQISMSREEMVLANTGLAIMFRLLIQPVSILGEMLKDHPEKELITLDNIDKLSKKFKINQYNFT